jgi:uncharacterized protein (TIGR00369 family)
LESYAKILQQKAQGTFWSYLGCELVKMETDKVIITIDIQDHHLNHLDILHGGVHSSLLDNAMGLVAMAARPEEKIVTTNLNVHFVAPAHKGKVTVVAEIVHISRKMITAKGTLTKENGDICSFGTGSFRTI